MSTLPKDLKLLKPQLARFYEQYTQEVYGVRITVTKKHFARFQKRGNELERLGIFPRDYAKRLLHELQWLVKKKGWKCIPFNTFLGKYAQQLYLETIGNKQFEDIRDDDEDFMLLVLDEYKIIQYMHTTNTSFRSAVQTIGCMLGSDWKYAFESDNRAKIAKSALELFNTSMGTSYKTYEDVYYGG